MKERLLREQAEKMLKLSAGLTAVVLLPAAWLMLVSRGLCPQPGFLPDFFLTVSCENGLRGAVFVCIGQMLFWYSRKQEGKITVTSIRCLPLILMTGELREAARNGLSPDLAFVLLLVLLIHLFFEFCWRRFAGTDGAAV